VRAARAGWPVLALLCATLAGAADKPSTDKPWAVRALERELALARSDSFYLVVELPASRLRLMHGGALLRELPVRAVLYGAARIAFVERGTVEDWADTTWTDARLEPARERPVQEIVPGDDDATQELPPLPEEAYPAPSVWQAHFSDGFVVEFCSQASGGGLVHRLGEIAAALGSTSDVAPRLRVVLAPDDLGSLYRAFPEGASLVLAPGAAP